jgi:hypothetical protein
MTAGLLDCIDTPRNGHSHVEGVRYWCADNGCFGSGYPGHEKYLGWLERNLYRVGNCAFATAPDVVGDAEATLDLSAPFLPQIRKLGYPAALVAQDGLESLEVPWSDFDVLFLGGSTGWKLGEHAAALTAKAVSQGKWVHMGRVNSFKRITYAKQIGCTSSDGTYISFGPSKNLPKVLSWLERLEGN